ncbi:hypothetical protein [Alicyclobacillus macrosporangiidus]|uniref:hypothetical protein n=1 Tax=Alicyclobacillus macrosporangiidus TaxID=392015 RepID=UPI0026EDECF2|nr:hypothetical protein [Alicyclobacillus macrosporangiidus]
MLQREITFRRADLVAYPISQMERDLTDLTDDDMMGTDGMDPAGPPAGSANAVEAATVEQAAAQAPVDAAAASVHRAGAPGRASMTSTASTTPPCLGGRMPWYVSWWRPGGCRR